jgi:hypothetical protein
MRNETRTQRNGCRSARRLARVWQLWMLSFACLGCSGSCHRVDMAGLTDSAAAQPKSSAGPTKAGPAGRTRSKAPRVPLGVNLGSLSYYSPTLPFLDVMKNADSPQTTKASFGGPWNTELVDKVPFDAAGWPLEIPYSGPGVAEPQRVRYSVVSLTYPGRYTLLYDGDGEFEFPAAPVKVLDQAPGTIYLDVQHRDEGSVFLTITRSAKANHVRNVRLILPGYDKTYATQVFHPRFLEQIKGASVLRFMDWQRTNNSELAHWKDRATPQMSQATWRGASIETMIDLANRVDADPWLCVPHLADDDFVEQMAKVVKERLAPGRVVYIEYSNEIWNGIFGQYKYASEQGCKAGLNKLGSYAGSCDDDGAKMWAGTKYTAKRAAKIFDTFERVFGGTDRIVRVLAGQAAFVDRNEVLLKAFADPAINPKRVKADALAIAPYFGGVANDLAEKQGASSLTVETILQHMDSSIQEQVRDLTRQNKAVADKYGMRLVAYEGGQHLVANGELMNDESLTQKLIAANRHPRMSQLYEKMFDAWYSASGRDLLVLFNSAEMPSKYGSWGLLENQEQLPERAPKYRAFRDQLIKLSLTNKPPAQ